jgi:hypothetical protein
VKRNPEYDKAVAQSQQAFEDYMSHLCLKCLTPFIRCQEKIRLREFDIGLEKAIIYMEVYVD